VVLSGQGRPLPRFIRDEVIKLRRLSR